MKPDYERANLIITVFGTKDVIATSGEEPVQPVVKPHDLENAYGLYSGYDQAPGSWF